MKNIHILGISGSLREDSANTTVLSYFQELTSAHISFQIFHGLDQIPHFSPGIEENGGVRNFKNALRSADGAIVCTPEYAFGVPGSLKNALDWTVSTAEFNEKPVSLIAASPLNTGGEKALASLLLTFTALGATKNALSELSIPNIKQKIAEGKVTDPATMNELQNQFKNLLDLIRANRA